MEQPTSIDFANWMKQLSPLIKDWPLKKVVMPGTHDSAMYKGMLPADYAKTQNLDFTGQLESGVRFFDFRVDYFWKGCDIVPGSFYDPREGGQCWSCPPGYNRTWAPVTASNACAKQGFLGISWFGDTKPATFQKQLHGPGLQSKDGVAIECVGNIIAGPDYYMYGHGNYVVDIRLSDALGQIRSWIQQHTEEVVIINFTAYERDGNDPGLKSLIYGYLPNLIDDTSAPQNATINDVKGKVLLLRDGVQTSWGSSGCIRSIGYKSDTSGIEDVDTMMSYLDQELDQVRPQGTTASNDTYLLEVKAALTPKGEGHTLVPGNPQDLAKKFNPLLADKLGTDQNVLSADYKGWQGRPLNIISVDYIDISNVAENIIKANFYVPS